MAAQIEVTMPSQRMIAAVRAFLARHPEYTQQVYREYQQHLEQEPYLTQERVLVGYESGLLPLEDDVVAGKQEVVDYGKYTVNGRMLLAWQDLD